MTLRQLITMVFVITFLFLGVVFIAMDVQETDSSTSGDPTFGLPSVSKSGDASVEQAIEQRRSVRTFQNRPLTRDTLCQLLWSGQGITDPEGFRAAPSAGALYPLELYVVAGNVNQLPSGVYHYRPEQHELTQITAEDVREPLATEAYEQEWIAEAPAVIVIGGIYARTTGKYGQRGRRYVHIEVGHVAQNIYLQAESTGLGTTIVGAFDDEGVRELLNLPDTTQPLAIMPTGHPSHE